MKSLLPYWPMLAFALNLVAVWICWTLRQLAKSEMAKAGAAIEEKIGAVTSSLDSRVDDHQNRLLVAEGEIRTIRAEIQDLPTKADIAELRGEVKAVGRDVAAANSGIDRIENFFLAKGVERVS